MRTLLVDNYDSYTYNLFQLIARVNGVEPLVLRNDAAEWDFIDLGDFDNAVVSPGPGHPGRSRDFGRSTAALSRPGLPVLGVCLGHQGLGWLSGAEVAAAPQPRHGHLTTVRHDGSALFAGIPREFTAVRYHSLCLTEPLPANLTATAWAEDGVVMGIADRDQPRWGVQFHPESIATEHGETLLVNFRDLTRGARSRTRAAPVLIRPRRASPAAAPVPSSGPSWRVHARVLAGAADTERVFRELYGNAPASFWLDSGGGEPGLARFSFLGDAGGPRGEVLTYRVGSGSVRVEPTHGTGYRLPGTIFDVLDRRLTERRVHAPELPFDFPGGYVGYFGYELKADCGSPNHHVAKTPDALWLFADRLVAVDHEERRTYALALAGDDPAEVRAARDWLDHTEERLRAVPAGRLERPEPRRGRVGDLGTRMDRGPARYLRDIATCKRLLREGESYEICLTDTLRVPPPTDDLELYLRMRRSDPAPYAALFRHPELTVASASPERFLRIWPGGRVESEPIKGTAPRGDDPVRDEWLRRELATSPKTRAENLMIVDLIRNDLGRVCEIGSVSVPRFMATKSYATMHQLVSAIRGQLRADVSAVGCVRACFPGGSMTGAPKPRAMEIIDRLETGARGVYSGSLGYLGLSGAADLNIVIRTATIRPDQMTVGAGGAIVLDSDPHSELEEMLLKAAVPLRALDENQVGARVTGR